MYICIFICIYVYVYRYVIYIYIYIIVYIYMYVYMYVYVYVYLHLHYRRVAAFDEEGELQFLLDRTDLGTIMQRCVFFPKSPGASFLERIAELEKKAQPEDWRNRLRNNDAPEYLVNYINYKFALSWKHRQGISIEMPPNNSAKLRLIFATGLLDLNLQPIYGVFERRKDEDVDDAFEIPDFKSRYVFQKWDTHLPNAPEALDLLSTALLNKGCENAGLRPEELRMFDPSWDKVDVSPGSIEHILRKKFRFQQDNDFQGVQPGQGGWAVDDPSNLATQFKHALNQTMTLTRYDRSTPVITCFQLGQYQWLLPLLNPSQVCKQAPSLTVVLRPAAGTGSISA